MLHIHEKKRILLFLAELFIKQAISYREFWQVEGRLPPEISNSTCNMKLKLTSQIVLDNS